MADPRYPHPLIAREGWAIIGGVALVCAVLLGLGWWWSAALGLLVLVFVLQFFRDPPRVVPAEQGVVLAPADGRVVKVQKVRDPYLDREALLVSVFMNVFNVHSNRSPVDGQVREVWYNPGSFVNADLDKASTENERSALWLRTDEGHDVVCVQVAGLVARRIVCYAGAGERLARGQRYGFIRFGSRVDVYLPTGARARVSVGDKVAATSSIIAALA
jgi:phosphatidylserine decarboxylase